MAFVWIVGSQQGFLGNLDDCIIHGVFPDKQTAIANITKLQEKSPLDSFGLIPIPIGLEVNIGFNMNQSWRWYKPIQADESETDFSCDINVSESLLSEDRSLASCVDDGVHITPRYTFNNQKPSYEDRRMSAPCNIIN